MTSFTWISGPQRSLLCHQVLVLWVRNLTVRALQFCENPGVSQNQLRGNSLCKYWRFWWHLALGKLVPLCHLLGVGFDILVNYLNEGSWPLRCQSPHLCRFLAFWQPCPFHSRLIFVIDTIKAIEAISSTYALILQQAFQSKTVPDQIMTRPVVFKNLRPKERFIVRMHASNRKAVTMVGISPCHLHLCLLVCTTFPT